MSKSLSNIDKQALREELSNPAIGSNAHLRKLALALLDEPEAKDQRNAELEAREVKLPLRFDVKTHSCSEEPDGEWYARDDVLAALANAGVRIYEEG